MNTESHRVYEWGQIDWRHVERAVFKLQKRIYRASQQGNNEKVHQLQRLLIASWTARALAVRRVTQDNRGKKTAGIDGMANVAPGARMQMIEDLRSHRMASPVRRVWIPKPGKTEMRPLGIPVMIDRAHQALVKLALEPQWEAKFEPHSYGFRPGRSAHDAVEFIFNCIKFRPRYVLDADIKGCFDNIDHEALLDKLETYPAMRRVIKQWLEAGLMEGLEFTPTDRGTPQGGVISPLLANIALHGLEKYVQSKFLQKREFPEGIDYAYKPKVVRYADDFLVMHHHLDVIEACKEHVSQWLAHMGLELHEEKTRITHTLERIEGKVGVDFLGFHFRHFQVGKTHWIKSGKANQGTLNFKTIIKPSNQAIKRHYRVMSEVISRFKAAPQDALIHILNPKILGWSAYYSTVNSKMTFNKLDHLVVQRLLRWGRRRHAKISRYWVVNKYFNPRGLKGPTNILRPWDFCTHEQDVLRRYADRPIQRHVMVKGSRSPYDGDWAYWARRMSKYPGWTYGRQRLLKKQKGKCALCGNYFQMEDRVEKDRILPGAFGGQYDFENTRLVHGHCHDLRHAEITRCLRDKNHSFEEPYELETLTYGSEEQPSGRPGG